MFLDLPEEPPTLVDADLEQLWAELAMHAQLVGGEYLGKGGAPCLHLSFPRFIPQNES